MATATPSAWAVEGSLCLDLLLCQPVELNALICFVLRFFGLRTAHFKSSLKKDMEITLKEASKAAALTLFNQQCESFAQTCFG